MALAALTVIVIAGVAVWLYRHTIFPTSEQAVAGDPVLTLPKGPSIAVLPFTNLSGDPDQEYFADLAGRLRHQLEATGGAAGSSFYGRKAAGTTRLVFDAGRDVLLVDGFDSDGQPDQLCSQRFYDDAHGLLQPDGVLVANLHHGHAGYPDHVERISRSFSGAVLVVDDADRSNSIVFACKGTALDRFRPSLIRPPKGLDKEAATQLTAAFARVSAAWKAQRA